MSDNDWFLDPGFDGDEQAAPGLRDAYKELKKQFKSLQADLTKAAERAAAAEAAAKATAFEQLLAEKKIPPRIARWIKRDEVEASAEAIDKWIAENGEDFGWKGEAPADKQEDAQAQSEQSLLTEDEIAQQRAVAGLSQEVSPPGDVESKLAALQQKYANSSDLDAVLRDMSALGLAKSV